MPSREPPSRELTCGAGFEPPFSHTVAVDRTPPGGLKGRAEASESELQALTRLYGVEEIRRLVFDYEIKPRGRGRYHLSGRMESDLVQACVITLEPVEETVSEDIDLEFWPADEIDEPRMAVAQGAGLELEDAGPPEPLHNGMIDVGAVAAEYLSSSMNPYPRKDGVEFCWSDDDNAVDGQSGAGTSGGAFSALQKLKLPK